MTRSKYKLLLDYEYDKLFMKHRGVWLSYAETAFDFSKRTVSGGDDPWPDDVAAALLLVLKDNGDLGKFELCAPQGVQDRLREYFSDYIVDQYFRTRRARS